LANKNDVAIVGGGVIGWSSAWHLLSRHPSLKVVVIDPDQHRCTSQRGAGGTRAQFSTDVNIALSLLSIEAFKRFPSEVGFDIGYHQNGYLLFTAQHDRAEKMKEAAEHQRDQGVPIDEVSIDDLKKRVPCLNTDDLVYAQIGLQDGYLDGPMVQRGYRAACLALGAEEMHAKAIGATDKQVQLDEGAIDAEHVIAATGHWSGAIGLDLPVKPEKHQLFYDAPGYVNPSWPFTIDADTTFHFRPESAGVLVCFNDNKLSSQDHEPDEAPHFEEEVLDRLMPLAEHRAPGFLDRDRINMGRAGYYAVTPDRHPIIGVTNGVFVATGFGGHGVMHSPAAGRVVSEIVLDGEAKSIDIKPLSPDRFKLGNLIKETIVF
jgi:sarcosine oxidase subunit beta